MSVLKRIKRTVKSFELATEQAKKKQRLKKATKVALLKKRR